MRCAWAAEPASRNLLELSLEELMEVEFISAPRFANNPAEIPSAVTVITRQQIGLYGWQTLADILQAQPGFTVTNDYTYSYAATRGLAVSGDYRVRSQVLINGNRLNENIYDSVNIDAAFPLDLATVDHIELIQGPSASVYGGNSMFGVVNIVTRPGQSLNGLQLRSNISSGNRQQLGLTYGNNSGDTDFLFNAQTFDGNGRTLEFAELAAAGMPSQIDSVDAETGYKIMGRVTHRDWRLSLHASGRDKTVPTGSYGTILGDTAHKEDDRNILGELGYRRSLNVSTHWDTRVYYGAYNYNGSFPYDYEPTYVINVDDAGGKWWGLETTIAMRLGQKQQVTMGLEYRDNYQQRQLNTDDGFGCFDIGSNEPCMRSHYDSRIASLYLQDEVKLTPTLNLSLGYRLDSATDFDDQHSPRLGLVQKIGRLGTLKYLYAQAYRLPNPYERFYWLPFSQVGNPALEPEDMRSHEVTWDLPTSRNTHLTTSVYRYTLDDFIGTSPEGQHLNLPAFSASGFETTWSGLMQDLYNFSVSYAQQIPDGEILEEGVVPKHMFKMNLAIPLPATGWTAGLEGRAFSHRHTSLAAERIAGYAIANLTLTWLPPAQHWQLQVGVKDIFDREYDDPVADDPLLSVPRDRIRQFGRSWFIDFGWQL
jgi:outer membrane cobalamin receptor